MPTLSVNGIRIFFQETGAPDAEPLLLIMGWGGDHTAWAFQVPAFAAGYRVIALDNRGAGQSDAPDEPYTIPGMAEDAVGVLDALGIRRAHICGASMGGMIAQELVLAHPDRVRTVQLHGTAAWIDAYGRFVMDSFLTVKARGDREENIRAGLPWIFARRTLAERPDFVRLWIERGLEYPHPTGLTGLRRQAEAIRGHDTRERLDRIRVPTLVTVGAEDILVPPVFSRELHARIPGAELVLIPDAGHVHFIEEPSLFNAMCLEFLAKHRGA